MRFPRVEAFALAIICLCSITFGSRVFAGDKIIVLAHETSWAPHYGKDLKQGGYTVEIIREALKRSGYTLETVWLPWKRAQVEAARGITMVLELPIITKKGQPNSPIQTL